MTEFNKGDIVVPTAETAAQSADNVANNNPGTNDVDRYIGEGGPLRVIGKVPPLMSIQFYATVPVDSDKTAFDEEAFYADPMDPQFDDLALMMAHEIEHDGGVLAGV